MNISVTACINAAQPIDQAALGAAVRYAAVDKDIVIVAAAGNEGEESSCGQNPVFNPLRPDDPRDWQDVSTIVTPAWFSDYVLTVGAVAPGRPTAAAEHRRSVGRRRGARLARSWACRA